MRSAPKPAGARAEFTASAATKTPRVGGARRVPLSERTLREETASAPSSSRDYLAGAAFLAFLAPFGFEGALRFLDFFLNAARSIVTPNLML